MKMIGIIKTLNKEECYGYIESGDNMLYLFYTDSINKEIKPGNLVRFTPDLINNIALEVEIINDIL